MDQASRAVGSEALEESALHLNTAVTGSGPNWQGPGSSHRLAEDSGDDVSAALPTSGESNIADERTVAGSRAAQLHEASVRHPERQERSKKSQQRYRIRKKAKVEAMQHQLQELSMQVQSLQTENEELLKQNLSLQRAAIPAEDVALPRPLQAPRELEEAVEAYVPREGSRYTVETMTVFALAQPVGLHVGPGMSIRDIIGSTQAFIISIRSQLVQMETDGSPIAGELLTRTIMQQRAFTRNILRSQTRVDLQLFDGIRLQLLQWLPESGEHLHREAVALAALTAGQMMAIAEAAARHVDALHRIYADRRSSAAALVEALDAVDVAATQPVAEHVQVSRAQDRLHNSRYMEHESYMALVMLFVGTDLLTVEQSARLQTHMLPMFVDWAMIGRIVLDLVRSNAFFPAVPPALPALESVLVSALSLAPPASNYPLGGLHHIPTATDLLPQPYLENREWMMPYLDETQGSMAPDLNFPK